MVVMKNAYVLLFIAIVAEVAATSFESGLLTGVAYAIWSRVGIVLISIVGWVVFEQSLGLQASTRTG
jgi:multidrug transporter EmrE-like cation transporter